MSRLMFWERSRRRSPSTVDGTVDRLAQAHDFFFSEVADLGVGVDGKLGEDRVRGGPAHAVDVGENRSRPASAAGG